MKQTTKSRVLSLILVLAMVFSMLPTAVFAAETTATYTKVTTAPTDWTGEYLLVYEAGALAFDGSLETPDVANNYVGITILNDSITMKDHSAAVFIEAVEGGYVLKSASGLYLYHNTDANKLSSTENQATAAKYPLAITVADSGVDLALSCGPHMRFNKTTDQMRFRYFKSSSYANQQPVALYKLEGVESGEPEPTETTAPTEPEPTETTPPAPSTDIIGQYTSSLDDGDQVLLYYPTSSKVMTTEGYTYVSKNGSTKEELCAADAVLSDTTLTAPVGSAVLTVSIDADGHYTFVSQDSKYLYLDGTNVQFADAAGEYTLFDLETAENGFYIKSTNAAFNDKAQYMEYYSGYFTCYGLDTSKANIYTFQFYKLNDDGSGDDSGETIPSEPTEPEVTVSTIAEALAGENGTEFTVKGVVTLIDGKNVHIQDSTGGINLYCTAAAEGISVGDTVIGTGSKGAFKGLPQLSSATFEKSEGLTISAKETTIGALADTDLCTYLSLKNLTVSAIEGTTVTVTDGTDSIQIYKAVLPEGIAVDCVINFNGALSTYNGYQLRNTLASEITIVPAEEEPEYVPISTALAGENGTEFTVKGVVTLVDGQNYYLKDDTGAICVRMSSKPTDIALGDTIIGTGSKTVYNGLPQLGSGTYEKSSGLTLSAKETTIDALTTADIATYIKLKGVQITEVYDKDGTYTTPNITVTDGANTIQIYKAVIGKNEDGTWAFAVGDKIDVLAAVGVYNTTLQLRNTLASEITEAASDSATGKLTSANQFVTGNYAMVVDGGYAMGALDGTWISVVQPTIENDVVTDAKGGVWTLTVNGNTVQITDSNGATIMPKGGNNNGIASGSYEWAWSFDEATQTFTFAGTGDDTVKLASNANEDPTYGGFHKFRGYKNKTISSNPATYPCNFTLYPVTEQEVESTLPAAGDEVVLYNLSAQGVLAAENDTQSIENAPAQIVDGKAVPANGGVVFNVEISEGYYRFHNETYGYLCSNGTGNNAFYSAEASADADWTLHQGKSGGWFLESRTAKFNEKYSQYLEYYADSYKTYSMNKVTDYDIYEFFFYPAAEDVSLTGGIVNAPAVNFGTLYDAIIGADYTFSFTVDAVFGIDGELTVTTGNTVLTANEDGTYTIPAELVTGEALTVTVTGIDTKGVTISGAATVTIKDEPAIGEVTPAAGAETGEDKAPVISAVITNAGEEPEITVAVNGEEVEAVYADGTVSYTPTENLAEGRTTVTVTVKRADGKEVSKTWAFTVGQAQYQLYFGQLHSHTTYSDGSGSLESALQYIASLPESANVDFVAFTDHSNYFDASGAANPEGALYDMTLATADSQKLWTAYKQAINDFNASHSDVIAIGGFEMTWSGGPGHINTFNTPGIVSRNNTTLNSKTNDAGMKAYYSLLSQTNGMWSVNQFNHPGSTFGTFSDFAYWDPVIDTRIQLVEVGNGEGQIGAGGYFPSYEYYTMALDKGWHVAPTNNQDNHKGKWGNANDARDVILTDDFSEVGIYSAIHAMRLYATEDKNLEIGYSVNGQLLGSSITEVPEKLNFEVTVYDPDASDSISKVELIVNSGKVAHTWSDPADLADGALETTLDPTYSYYYVRVTEGDGDLAVTAPVWVGEMLKLGISAVETATSTPVTDEELTITTTLFNSEAEDATVKALVYTIGDEVIGTDNTGYTVGTSSTASVDFKFTPTAAKLTTVTVTAIVEQNGTEYEFTMDIELDVQDASKLVYIGIDASHYNEYVNGNYKDSMGNFSALAAEYGVRTVTLYESEDLIAACSNEKYKALILTAPSRRSAEAQASDPLKVYTEEELAAINAFNREGGTVILAGWSDHYENYPNVESIANMQAQEHMAATQNAILEMLGSSLRIGDDATYDDDFNGGQAYRLYFNTYGESFLTEGVEVDPENPHNRLYTEVFSHYGGASVYTADGTLPSTVTPIVFGHSGTYSVDVDKDGLGGEKMPKYTYAEGDDRLMIMASEQLEGQGLIIVSGAAFMSNFEVQATIEDSGSEKNYSNYKICENLLNYVNPVTITDIADVMAQTEVGYKYTIEGTVTSNASGYDKDTAFFDCIYVQDETGGICCFPVAGNFKIGDMVRITGTTEFYQGEPELQVSSIEVIGEGEAVEPTEVTAAQINDRSAEGKLITLNGKVTSFELANGLVQTILVEDEAGDTARVFIDGYITTAEDVQDLEVGCTISVTGLASYDDTFNAPEGPFPRIRVRDRADVICTAHVHDFEETVVKPDCVADGYTEYLCQDCGYSYRDSFVPATGHTTTSQVVAPKHDLMGYTITSCKDCEYSFIHSFVDALEHEFVKEITKAATCTAEGEMTFTCECGLSYTQVIPVTGHSCTATVVAPDCDHYGYTVYQCSDCDYHYLADPTEPTGHSYTGKYVGNGLMQYTCDCGHTYTDLHECPSAEYEDLDPERWYHEATDYVIAEKIMQGTAEATFSPNSALTRGQMVTILYRLAGEPEVTGETPFTDVAEGSYYADAVVWGYETGLIKGMTDTEFGAGQSVTRQQMATFLYRYAGSPEVSADAVKSFTDSDQISAFALDAMNWAAGNGLINGTTATTLSPKDATTRVQAAMIIFRYLTAE